MKTYIKYGIVAALLLVSNYASYNLGSQTIEKGSFRTYNTAEALQNERKLTGALMSMLHSYYEFLDVTKDENDSVVARHEFWRVIMDTDAYLVADSILCEEDWRDFYLFSDGQYYELLQEELSKIQ